MSPKTRSGASLDDAHASSSSSASSLLDTPPHAEASTTDNTNDILTHLASDVNGLSSEGKMIVSSIVKAMQMILSKKDEKITKLQSQKKVD